MNLMSWSIQTSPQDAYPSIVSEYVLNDIGVFVKRERRMPKNRPFTAVTGFRVGYASIPGTDYRAAPVDRNAILWHKITSVEEASEFALTVRGNQNDKICIFCPSEIRNSVLNYIAEKRKQHPPVTDADPAVAAWLCWRDDDDWGDPFMPLPEMIEMELNNKRFIEPEILAETIIAIDESPTANAAPNLRTSFCTNCGAALYADAKFCDKCGTRILR